MDSTMTADKYVAIDPGANGALVVFDRHKILDIYKLIQHNSFPQMLDIIPDKSIAYIEDIRLRPQDARGGMFIRLEGFIRQHERLKCALRVKCKDYEPVPPLTWQKSYGLVANVKGAEKKNRHKKMAMSLPENKGIKITLTNVDAILIARWAQRRIQQTKIK